MITDEKLFDLSFLQQIEDEMFLTEVIGLFLKDTQADLGEMRQKYAAGNLETVSKTAHRLKSSAGMLQANRLLALLSEIEKSANKGVASNQLAEWITMAQYEFDRLKLVLELYLVPLSLK